MHSFTNKSSGTAINVQMYAQPTIQQAMMYVTTSMFEVDQHQLIQNFFRDRGISRTSQKLFWVFHYHFYLVQKQPTAGDVLHKKVFLEISQNSQENTCAKVKRGKHLCHLCSSFFIKKETLAQVFSCEFCAVSKNIFLQNIFRPRLLLVTS